MFYFVITVPGSKTGVCVQSTAPSSLRPFYFFLLFPSSHFMRNVTPVSIYHLSGRWRDRGSLPPLTPHPHPLARSIIHTDRGLYGFCLPTSISESTIGMPK